MHHQHTTSEPPQRGKTRELSSLVDHVDGRLDLAIRLRAQRDELDRLRLYLLGRAEQLAERPVLLPESRQAIVNCRGQAERLADRIAEIDLRIAEQVRLAREQTGRVRQAARVSAILAEQFIRVDGAGLSLTGVA